MAISPEKKNAVLGHYFAYMVDKQDVFRDESVLEQYLNDSDMFCYAVTNYPQLLMPILEMADVYYQQDRDTFINLINAVEVDRNVSVIVVIAHHGRKSSLKSIKEFVCSKYASHYVFHAELLNEMRIRSFNQSDKFAKIDQICGLIEANFVNKRMVNYDAISYEENSTRLNALLDVSWLGNKTMAATHATVQFKNVLGNQALCISYFKRLDEIIREKLHLDLGQFHPRENYNFSLIDGLMYPVEMKNNVNYLGSAYKGRLDQIILDILRQAGLMPDITDIQRWSGFVEKTVADCMVLMHAYFIEDKRDISALMHGIRSHMLQYLLLAFAIDDKRINLAYGKSGEKILPSDIIKQLAIENTDPESRIGWTDMLDAYRYTRLDFKVPHHVNTFIMFKGDEHGFQYLAEMMRYEFVRAFTKQLNLYRDTIPECGTMTAQQFSGKLNGLSLLDFRTLEISKRHQFKKIGAQVASNKCRLFRRGDDYCITVRDSAPIPPGSVRPLEP